MTTDVTKHISVGIDAAADSVAVCVLGRRGAVVDEFACAASATEIVDRLRKLKFKSPSVIGIEAGSAGTFVSRGLISAGFDVRVLEARSVSSFLKLRQNKSDRNDARGIADIVRLDAGVVPTVLLKSQGAQMFRSELVLRHRLMKQRVAIENALRAVLRLNGAKIGRVFSGTHLDRAVRQEIDRLKQDGIDLSTIVEPVLDITVMLRRTLERCDRRLATAAAASDVCRRLMSVPGVGCICAVSFFTAIDDPERFERNEDVGPYLGLVPKLYQSGITSHLGRISRRGNMMTRTHLVSAAKSLMQQPKSDCALRRWGMAISERAGKGKARVALARKIAILLLAIWKSGAAFQPEPKLVGRVKFADKPIV